MAKIPKNPKDNNLESFMDYITRQMRQRTEQDYEIAQNILGNQNPTQDETSSFTERDFQNFARNRDQIVEEMIRAAENLNFNLDQSRESRTHTIIRKDLYVVTGHYSDFQQLMSIVGRENYNLIKFIPVNKPDDLRGIPKNSYIWLYNAGRWPESFLQKISEMISSRQFPNVITVNEITQPLVIDLERMFSEYQYISDVNPNRHRNPRYESQRENQRDSSIRDYILYIVHPDIQSFISLLKNIEKENRHIMFKPITNPSHLIGLKSDAYIFLFESSSWPNTFEKEIKDYLSKHRFQNVVSLNAIPPFAHIDLQQMFRNAGTNFWELDYSAFYNSGQHGRASTGQDVPNANPFTRGDFDWSTAPIDRSQIRNYSDRNNPIPKTHNSEHCDAYKELVRLMAEGKKIKTELLDILSKVYDTSIDNILCHENCVSGGKEKGDKDNGDKGDNKSGSNNNNDKGYTINITMGFSGDFNS